MSRNKEHRPNGAAAEGGRPIGSVFFAPAHLFCNIMNVYGYALYIPYIFHIYIYVYIYNIHIYLCPKSFPITFHCVVRNFFSHQLTSVA